VSKTYPSIHVSIAVADLHAFTYVTTSAHYVQEALSFDIQ